jgi:hypothetical protein
MKQKQLKRIFNIIREMGDRLIVADNESDEIFVIMNLDEYENLAGVENDDFATPDFNFEPRDSFESFEPVGDFLADDILSDEDALGKINNDIAEWRVAEQKKEEEQMAEDLAETAKENEPAVFEASGPKMANRFTPMAHLSDVLSDEKYLKREFDDSPRVKAIDEEDLADVPAEADQKFYLEPVE